MKILIAGGGTGGHVYPAITLAKAFLQIDPQADIQFVGTSRGIETKLVPAAGFKLHTIEVGRLNANVDWSERFWTLVGLPMALWQAARLVFSFRPDIVLGVGGYASAPTLVTAALLGRFTVIWDPNAIPGLANRILSWFAKLAIVVFDQAKPYLKTKDIVQIPMPVRGEMDDAKPRVPQSAEFCVLVFGGSQGARAINNAVLAAVKRGGDWLKQTRIVHQTGSTDFQTISKEYQHTPAANGKVDCREYLNDMYDRYNWADIVICRSGTGTISELAAMGKASILIPLPTAADDHQTKNALALVDAGAAVLLPQSELNSQTLSEKIEHFKNHPEELEKLETHVKKFHKSGSAIEIVKLITERQLLS